MFPVKNPQEGLTFGQFDVKETFENQDLFEVLNIVTDCAEFKDRAQV